MGSDPGVVAPSESVARASGLENEDLRLYE